MSNNLCLIALQLSSVLLSLSVLVNLYLKHSRNICKRDFQWCLFNHAEKQSEMMVPLIQREREAFKYKSRSHSCGFFTKHGLNPASFCLFSFFSQDKYSTKLTINDESIDGVLGTRTRGRGSRMVGADKLIERWWHRDAFYAVSCCVPQSYLLLYLHRKMQNLYRVLIINKNDSQQITHYFISTAINY